MITTSDSKMVEVVRLLRRNAEARSQRDVFTDLVGMTALAFRNTTAHLDPDDNSTEAWESREKQYLAIVQRYSPAQVQNFVRAWALIVIEMDEAPRDVLGDLYMRMELGDKGHGQFFTPYSVAQLMADFTVDGLVEQLKTEDTASVYEPACGAGALLIALTQALREAGVNYQQRLRIEAEDISEIAVQMTYLQLSLLHAPAEIRQQNTLSRELWDTWRTPALLVRGRTASMLRHPSVVGGHGVGGQGLGGLKAAEGEADGADVSSAEDAALELLRGM